MFALIILLVVTPLLVLIGETLGVSLVTALRLSLVKHPLVSPINTLRVVSDSKNTSYSPRATKRTKTILLVQSRVVDTSAFFAWKYFVLTTQN